MKGSDKEADDLTIDDWIVGTVAAAASILILGALLQALARAIVSIVA